MEGEKSGCSRGLSEVELRLDVAKEQGNERALDVLVEGLDLGRDLLDLLRRPRRGDRLCVRALGRREGEPALDEEHVHEQPALVRGRRDGQQPAEVLGLLGGDAFIDDLLPGVLLGLAL